MFYYDALILGYIHESQPNWISRDEENDDEFVHISGV